MNDVKVAGPRMSAAIPGGDAGFDPRESLLTRGACRGFFMSAIPIARPEAIGLDPAAIRRADELVQRWVTEDRMPAAGWVIGRRGRMLEPRLVGRQRPAKDAPALRKDALFLIASPTKPVACTAIMMLLERGRLALDDRVADYVPAFAANGKRDVQIRHLLTHTSR